MEEKEPTELELMLSGYCRYNEGVRCDKPLPRRCGGCGWDPVVRWERLRRRNVKESCLDNGREVGR